MRNQASAGGDTGASAVEFALVLMLLILLLFGIMQYGYTFFEYIQVAHSAREAVRWGALGATDAEIRTRAAAAAPELGADATISIVRTGVESIAVTVEHPVTMLTPLPQFAVPASVRSTAVQRVE